MAGSLRARKVRGFELAVIPEGAEVYGLRLRETNGSKDSPPLEVTHMRWRHARRILPSALDALRVSKVPKTALSANRGAPIRLSESAGVRLALIMLATSPVFKHARVEKITGGIEAMSEEEAYYWYAKCVSESGARACRALRLLLAEE